MAGGGLLGSLPFLVYQWNSGGGTWEAVQLHAATESLGQRSLSRLIMMAESLLSDREHRAIWGGPPMPGWQLWLFPSFVAAACLTCLTMSRELPAASRVWARTAPLTLLFLAFIFFGTSLRVAEHHLVVQVPLAAAVAATAGWILMRRGRWAKVVVAAVAATYAGCALHWQTSMLGGLNRTGGVGAWSDGIYELTENLAARFPGREVTILDWGLQNSVYVLSDGAVRMREVYATASLERSDRNRPWLEEIRQGGVFVLNGAGNRYFPDPTTGFLRALAAGRPVHRRQRINQRSGAVYAEVVEIEPHTLREPQPDLSSLALPTRVTAGGARFSSQLSGVHQIEHGAWRWTERNFSVVLGQPETADATVTLRLAVNFPRPSWDKLGPVTVSARLDGRALPPHRLDRPGDHALRWDLEAESLRAPNRFEFQLDKAIPPGAGDRRELGIILVSAEFEQR